MLYVKKHIDYIRESVSDYLRNAKLNSLVLGVSGGIDSALVAAIVSPVCKTLDMKLIGMSLPSLSNKDDEVSRAEAVGKAYCDIFHTKVISDEILVKPLFELSPAYKNAPGSSHEMRDKIRRGNIKARLRMILLYDLAQATNGLVLSTDNYTEYLLGFWTLHGDVGDLSPIQMYWKTEVYEMSQYIVDTELKGDKNKRQALQRCIDAVPTDGLGVTNSDLDQIGVPSYKEVDDILQVRCDSKEMRRNPVYQRYIKTSFKRNNPYNIPRMED
jgi:NAD+ synthetase